jgi:DNA adenine methylase
MSLSLPSGARPFVKYAGGKTRLLPELFARLPPSFKSYHEPFVGGGALYWALARTGWLDGCVARLTDMNTELVRSYQAIQDSVEDVIRELRSMPNTAEFFAVVRAKRNGATRENPWRPDAVLASAQFIYLNKTGFNGLYRVNQSGDFNVPFGHYDAPKICDDENLRACAETLHRVKTEVCVEPFEDVLNYAHAGDLVYFDPPYLPLSKTSNFTSYTRLGFRLEDHVRLRDLALVLKDRGVHVMISNSANDAIRELYASSAFRVEEVQAARSVNSKGNGRGKIAELVIR